MPSSRHKLDRGRFLREQCVGTGVDDEAVDALGLDDAAERWCGFQQDETARAGARARRRRQGRSSRRRR